MRSLACAATVLVLASAACRASSDDDAAADDANDDDAADADDAGPGGDPCGDAEVRSGEATFYDFADGSGNCGFPATPDDLMVAAMNHTDYRASAACGTCVRIDGPDGSVDVRIVDQCPGCPEGDIDLSPEAFARIAPLEAGRVPIEWSYVSCNVDGPVVYHFKDGSNPYWTAVQVRNHRHEIARFEFGDGTTWTEVPRVDYNYFVQESGMGEGPLSFRITDVLGNALTDSGIPLLDDADAPGAAQLPECAP